MLLILLLDFGLFDVFRVANVIIHESLDQRLGTLRAMYHFGQGLISHEISGWTHQLLLDCVATGLTTLVVEEDVVADLGRSG